MSSINKVKIHEGQVVAVPATDGHGFVLAVVARTLDPSALDGEALLYFFGPRHLDIPNINTVSAMNPSSAADIVRTGVLRIHEGEWPIIGLLKGFNRNRWPIPVFGRVDLLDPCIGYLVKYQEDTLAGPRVEEKTTSEIATQYVRDRLAGVDIAAYDTMKKLAGG